ncbi:imidazole glycerol phosphate synthase subunit HisH [Sphingobium nicotianae]|uniref:Imidazole glycerol phosphate synthase subunit HisH n=1 Tax=Sphingobium nicotianae TaxID=2782607 RepID=A0A9X1DAU9_9SPHN|nr:imidazole glycerol phosphate synthase subunit HisH [Sphingobium nicotianae]MBT2186531.1 imidazole glycerol phosphate synthase subunit HisH [Sphingobium nicotianae]
MTVALIDYGAGNLHSVHNALRAAGAHGVMITADAEVVRRSDRIVLPGVGAFRACIEQLRAIPGMIEAMREAVFDEGRPFLGICVGMQLLAEAGEEFGRHEGLGWLPGTVRLMERDDPTIKIPHMGWNDVVLRRPHDLIVPGEAYFLHSYQFEADDPADVIATTDHGGEVIAAVGRDNILGVQFHPEKSQAYGLATLSRFLEWRP